MRKVSPIDEGIKKSFRKKFRKTWAKKDNQLPGIFIYNRKLRDTMFFIERTNNKGFALNPYRYNLSVASLQINYNSVGLGEQWQPRARNKRKLSAVGRQYGRLDDTGALVTIV